MRLYDFRDTPSLNRLPGALRGGTPPGEVNMTMTGDTGAGGRGGFTVALINY